MEKKPDNDEEKILKVVRERNILYIGEYKWEWLKMSHQKQMHIERQENDICNPIPSKEKKNQNCQLTSLYLEFWNNFSRLKEN